jgi:hypothetical protein
VSGRRERALWERLAFLFDEDDGSLPELRIVGLSPAGLTRVVTALWERAAEPPAVDRLWHDAHGVEAPVRDVAHACELLVAGRIVPFHVPLEGIAVGAVALPALGAFVDPDEVVLDYRMGPDWNADVLAAFVVLLGELRALDAGARLDLEEAIAPQFRAEIVRAIDEYLAARGGR